jgi:hypothetical protein
MEERVMTWARARRTGTAAAALIAVGLLAPIGAGAAPTGAPPPDVVASATDGQLVSVSACGRGHAEDETPATLTVERPNATSGTIEVDVTYGGTLPTSQTDQLPDPIEIPAGQTSTTVEVPFFSNDSDTLTITVEPGTGYLVGDPATATSTITYDEADVDCPEIDDVIPVGGRPTAFPVEQESGIGPSLLDFGTDVAPPPGLTLEADGTWSGAATTPGTYRISGVWSQDGIPVIGATWVIEVRPNDDGTTTTTTAASAAPANAVPGNAAYTG